MDTHPNQGPVTVLVTGATGFVGSHTLTALSAMENVRVIATCRNPARLSAHFQGEVRVGDLNDAGFRKRVLQDVNAVAHCAAWTAAWGHRTQSDKHHLRPAIQFIDDVIAAGVKRFVHISSTALNDRNTIDDANSVGEVTPFFPHLHNVQRIEEYMRAHADQSTTFVNMRLGFFVGSNYGIGILPMLLPRLKTHLVPWVSGGVTHLPLIDGRDIGQAMAYAATVTGLNGYEAFNIIGPENPTVREAISFIHDEFGYPKPHFSVSFPIAYAFAWVMEKIDPIVWWDPLVTTSIIHFLENKHVSNVRAERILGYCPQHSWQQAVRQQVAEMNQRQKKAMPMTSPIRME